MRSFKRTFKRCSVAPDQSEHPGCQSPSTGRVKKKRARFASDILSFPCETAFALLTTIQTLIWALPCAWRCLTCLPTPFIPGETVFFSRGIRYEYIGSASVLPAAVCGETPLSQAEGDAAAACPRAGNSGCQRLCCPRPGPSSPARLTLRFLFLPRSRGC